MQFNNLLKNNSIKYKLTDSKKKNIVIGDGIGNLLGLAFNMIKIFKIIISIYRIQDISSNLCGMFCILFILHDIKSKNDFINFLTLFNSNDFLKMN